MGSNLVSPAGATIHEIVNAIQRIKNIDNGINTLNEE